MAKGHDKSLTNAPPDHKDPSHAAWKLEDTQIQLRMRNNREPQISRSLIYYTSAKQVWDQDKMFSGVSNLRRTYDLHQIFLSLTLDNMSLEAYYGRFRVVARRSD